MNQSAFELLQLGLGLVPFARPYQWNLDRLFAPSDRVRISSGGACGGRGLPTNSFVSEVRPPELQSIRQALRLEPLKAGFPCMCLGTIAIEFWRADELLTTVALHHHQTLRVPGPWLLDGVLKNGPALATWLAQHGHPEHLQQYQARCTTAESFSDQSRPSNGCPEPDAPRGASGRYPRR